MLKLLVVLGLSGLALAACGQPAEKTAPTVAQKAAAKPSDAVQTAPEVLSAADLRRVCRAGLAAIHGQPPMAIDVDGVDGGVVHASWRAPVDGGRMRADCRVEKDLIVWKPLDLPDATLVRWMNQADDPVVRYVMDGQAITVTQTLPDGTTEQAELAVPAEEEAR
ncbi:hypothetical protein GCM10017620_25640 [Brevundimonas intermedia]|uniref:Lipoprotein n=1 Tax=Brevundimonas intermedia TaxID=74315 RepID=A0ABQ5TB84_9CAUL|nr:hypothetical protein [Brevundimonas intermedia]GLK49591.1 hypothetical protein GCM10017620_25640 [Brevundimonas intermedia]